MSYTSGSVVVSGTVRRPDLVVTRYAFADFPASGVEIAASIERSFVDQLVDAGTVAVKFPNTTTAPAMGDVLAFDVKGVRAFAGLVKKRRTVTKDPREGAAMLTSCEGPGLLGLFARRPIFPPGGERNLPAAQTKLYNYTHPDYDESTATWVFANVLGTVLDGQAYWGGFTSPDAWDPDWIGAGDVDIIWATGTTDEAAPVGDCYFRDTFTTTFAGVHRLFFGVDNAGRVFVDGREVSAVDGSSGRTKGWQKVVDVGLPLSVGEHTIAIEAHNYSPTGPFNPGGVACGVWIPGYGSITPPTLVWATSGGMRVCEYPADAPGMTPGTVLTLECAPWPFVTLDFDTEVDSNNNPWPFFANITATVGRDKVLDLIRKLMTGGYADIWMDPSDWILHAVAYGDRGTSAGITAGQLAAVLNVLVHDEEDTVADGLLIATDAAGYVTRGAGDRVEFLELGGEYTEVEVNRLGDTAIDALDDPREQRTVAFDASTDLLSPYKNTAFQPGCTLPSPDREGTPTTDRVLEIGCAETSQNERLAVQLTVKDLIQSRNERTLQEIRG